MRSHHCIMRQTARRSAMFAVLAAPLFGCGRDSPGAPDGATALCARVAEAAALAQPGAGDAGSAEVVAFIPGGFGGVYGAFPGNTVVLLRPDSLAAAREVAARARACPGAERLPVLGLISAGVVAQRGRYDYAQLQRYLSALIGGAARGLTPPWSAGIDVTGNRVSFRVGGDADAAVVRAAAGAAAVPSDAYVVLAQ
jgi:hypothetical protein